MSTRQTIFYYISIVLLISVNYGYSIVTQSSTSGEIKEKTDTDVIYDANNQIIGWEISKCSTRCSVKYITMPTDDIEYEQSDLNIIVGNMRVQGDIEYREWEPTGEEFYNYSDWYSVDTIEYYDLITSWSPTGQSGRGVVSISCMLEPPVNPSIGQVNNAQVDCHADNYEEFNYSITCPQISFNLILVPMSVSLPTVSQNFTVDTQESCGTAHCYFDVICEADM